MVANFSVEDQIIARQIERAVPGASTLLQSITNGRKGNSLMQHKNETLVLGWLDPRNNSIMHAGVGFYNATYGEYLLKIDEEPCEKQYYLKTCACEGERTNYRMELIIKHKNGKFLKRQRVGTGYSTDGCVFINYGSKFKTLVLYLKGE